MEGPSGFYVTRSLGNKKGKKNKKSHLVSSTVVDETTNNTKLSNVSGPKHSAKADTTPASPETLAKYATQLESACNVVKSSCFFEDTIEFVRAMQFAECICYGVGCFSSSISSRLQLAYLRCVLERIEYSGSVHIFDPMFSESERQFLKSHLSWKVIENDENGCRLAQKQCLFFMPHCDRSLYNNVLKTNHSQLSIITIIGNSLINYIDSFSKEKDALYDLHTQQKIKEKLLPIKLKSKSSSDCCIHNFESFHNRCYYAFNNLAITTFS